MMDLPAWAEWRGGAETHLAIGVEEELMLLDGEDFSLVNRVDEVMPRLPESTAARATHETHGSALEVATGIHHRVADAVAELDAMRIELADTTASLGLRMAGSGTHPFAIWQETVISAGERYEFVHGSMRALARREPTFALHVHVGIENGDDAVRVYNRMRCHLPLLLALSANSPFWQGRDTGLASARTPLFQAFPRVGVPRPFRDYAHYVEEIDLLVATGAVPDIGFLWWDIRPKPALGTIEVRIMDTQTRSADTSSLVALVQSLVKMECDEPRTGSEAVDAHEVITENRFIAARDGVEAELIDLPSRSRRPVRDLLPELTEALEPHADELGCLDELERLPTLCEVAPAERQRREAADVPSLAQMVRALSDQFA